MGADEGDDGDSGVTYEDRARRREREEAEIYRGYEERIDDRLMHEEANVQIDKRPKQEHLANQLVTPLSVYQLDPNQWTQ